MTRTEINDKWLKGQCNRYVNGHCSTARCLYRAGHNDGKPANLDDATCEPHQILVELEALRRHRQRHIEQQKLTKATKQNL